MERANWLNISQIIIEIYQQINNYKCILLYVLIIFIVIEFLIYSKIIFLYEFVGSAKEKYYEILFYGRVYQFIYK